jgi:PAS domain S-box-containing protein
MDTAVIGYVGAGVGFMLALYSFFMSNKKRLDAQEWEQKANRLKEENDRLYREKREAESAADQPVAMDEPTAQGSPLPIQAIMEARAEAEQTAARLQEALGRIQEVSERADEAAARAEAAATRARELEDESRRLGTRNAELREQLNTLQARNDALTEEAKQATEAAAFAEALAAEAEARAAQPITLAPVAEAEAAPTTATLDPAVLAEYEANAAALVEARAQLENLEGEAERVRAELAEAVAERDRLQAEREQYDEEQDARYNKLQAFAEEQVGKLLAENRELKGRAESAGAATALGGDGVTERLTTLANIAPVGIFEADAAGKWRFVNPAWTRISGLNAEASAGDGWLNGVHEADRVGVETAWGAMLTSGTIFSRTFRLSAADAQTRWVALRAGQVTAGEEKTVIGVVEDITERRRAEESARSSAICLRSVVDASTESVVFLDRRGDITSWNPSAERMFGYAPDEAMGRSLMALLVPDDQAILRRALARAAQPDQLHASQLIEGLALCKNGMTMPVEISVAAWRAGEFGEEDADVRYTAIIRDVTERRQAEDFRRDKEAAEEANRAKSQFLANMSHELRTPLNAIIGFSEILHDGTFGDLTPKQERYVGNILSSGRHLLQLINDILDLSKVEAGHVAMEYVAFPVAVAIRNVEGLVKVLLQKKNLLLEAEVPADLPVLIADQAKFKQILYNLVSNAVKFTPEGGRITITATPLEGGKTLQVAVTDTGIGIKPEDQDRIFREFEQVDSSYARMQQGTGLGLALVRRFVDMHGGKIRVFSEGEGKGTTFIFTMPFTPPEEVEEEAALEAPVFPEGAEKPVVLVVDDDQAASELLTHHLQVAGYAVSRAFNGADALVLAKETHPSIVTLDVQLPDREGWAVLEALKADPATSRIPVLMVSIIEDRERAQALGAAECFVKPVVKERLLASIGREIAAYRAGGAVPALVESNGEDTIIMRGGPSGLGASAPNGAEPTAEEAEAVAAEATPRKRSSRSKVGTQA